MNTWENGAFHFLERLSSIVQNSSLLLCLLHKHARKIKFFVNGGHDVKAFIDLPISKD